MTRCIWTEGYVVNGIVRKEKNKYVFEPTNFEGMPDNIYFNKVFQADEQSQQKYLDIIKTCLAQKILERLE